MRIALLSVVAVCAVAGARHAAAQDSETYQYDDLGRLTDIRRSDNTVIHYDYDPAGNRTTETITGAGVAALAVGDVTASEGGNLVFTITRSGNTAIATSAHYATANGTAAAGADYTAISGTLNFAIGQTTQTVSVVSLDDATQEVGETLALNLSAPSAGATLGDGQGIGTIVDNDVTSFVVSDVVVAEGGGLSFTVTRNGSTTLTHQVSYATADGAATAGFDYTATSGTLTFAPSASPASQTVTVNTTQDAAYEDNETLLVNLSAPTNGAVIGDGQGVGTINNDDTAPPFTISDASIAEGGTLSFTVTRSGNTALTHQVSYMTADGTASSSSDYTSQSGTLTFAPSASASSQTVTVSTTQDSAFEPGETLVVNLSLPTNGATIADNQGTGTLNDDEPAPPFTISDAAIGEGGTLSFTVTRSGNTTLEHRVNYATADGTATSGSDYTAASGTLIFAPSATASSQTVTVGTTQDSVYEGNEIALVNLSAPTNGAAIGDGQGAGTINNDDTAPSFTVSDASTTEGGVLSFTVTRSGNTALQHDVNYATANGTATSGSDYTAKSGTLTFAPGASASSQTVAVSTIDDTATEPNETVLLDLSGATQGASIGDSQGVGTIAANDQTNFPPAANNDSGSMAINTQKTFNVLQNDSDPDGDTLTITNATRLTSLPLTFSIGCGATCINVNLAPTRGTHSIRYTVSDGHGNTATAILTITVF